MTSVVLAVPSAQADDGAISESYLYLCGSSAAGFYTDSTCATPFAGDSSFWTWDQAKNTLTITSDGTIATVYGFQTVQDVQLDVMDGVTLTITRSGSSTSAAYPGLQANSGTLTITGGANGTGHLVVAAAEKDADYKTDSTVVAVGPYANSSGVYQATVVLASGTLTATAKTRYAYAAVAARRVTVQGGTLVATGGLISVSLNLGIGCDGVVFVWGDVTCQTGSTMSSGNTALSSIVLADRPGDDWYTWQYSNAHVESGQLTGDDIMDGTVPFDGTTKYRYLHFHADAPYVDTVVSAVQVGGVSTRVDSAAIDVTFDPAVEAWPADSVTIDGATVTGDPVQQADAGVWRVPIAAPAADGDQATVAVTDFDDVHITSDPVTVTLFKNTRTTPVGFTAAESGGRADGYASSTGIVLSFSPAVPDLTVGQVSLSGGVTKGDLTSSDGGATWLLGVALPAGTADTVATTVTIDDTALTTLAFASLTADVTLLRDTRQDVTFSVSQVGGFDGTADTTGLLVTLAGETAGLVVPDAAVTLAGATAGVVSAQSAPTTWLIPVSGFANGDQVTVTLADWAGVEVTSEPQSVTVWRESDQHAVSSAADELNSGLGWVTIKKDNTDQWA
ncbi:MAG: hypothetical protein LBR33_12295, partial [Propionibacteriaceae bacterium]|nr:hypothetical protein [Propionibacteriaceae bacterium]